MTDKLREAAQQAERDAFEAAYTMAYPFSASAPGKFYRDQDGYADVFVTVGWRMWQAALAQQDAQAVPQGEAIVEEFSAWLNERRGMSVAWVFHDVVAKFSAMLNAAPTPPAQRVMLTDQEIRDLWSWSMTAEAERTANTQQHAFAYAVIQAYERKNGKEAP